MNQFNVFRIYNEEGKVSGRVERASLAELDSGEVVIHAHYSSVNYKDALAATGAGKIISNFPRIGGIDVAGTVEASTDPDIKQGDSVLVTGYAFGVDHDGGYAEKVRVPAEWVIPVPRTLSLREAMIIGTAGFTAALCVARMEINGQRPEQGPIVVTGATGGVGNLAIDMLSKRGYAVTALTGKPEEAAYLQSLGATEILDRRGVEPGSRPLEQGRWGGAIDNVGGEILAWLTRTVKPWGSIAAVGLAGGSRLETTVMPFILRGVAILGITSSGCPTAWRHEMWKRIGADLKPDHLDLIVSREVTLAELHQVFEEMLAGRTKGRTIVRLV